MGCFGKIINSRINLMNIKMENKKINIAYGFHSVESIINNRPSEIKKILIDQKRKDKRIKNLIDLLKKNNIPYESVNRKIIDEKTHNKNNQGVVVEYQINENIAKEADLQEILKKENVFILILDEVQDPHNLGACIRTANAVGVDVVIAPKDRAVGLTPTVRKIASGAIENTPFLQVTNLSQTIKIIKKENVWCFGTDGEATANLYETDLTGRTAIIMGSEGEGLRRLTKENCDSLVKIPMIGNIESLNVSVATGVVLFEALRQRIIKK